VYGPPVVHADELESHWVWRKSWKSVTCGLSNLVLSLTSGYREQSTRGAATDSPTMGFCWKTGTAKQTFYIRVLVEKRSQHRCSIIHHITIEKVFDYVCQEASLWQVMVNCNYSCSIILSKSVKGIYVAQSKYATITNHFFCYKILENVSQETLHNIQPNISIGRISLFPLYFGRDRNLVHTSEVVLQDLNRHVEWNKGRTQRRLGLNASLQFDKLQKFHYLRNGG